VGNSKHPHQKLVQAIAADPENANAHFNLGDLLYFCGLFADAAQAYEGGLKLEPANAQGWFVLGNAFAQMEIWEGARLSYAQTLEIDPGHEQAKANLAFVDESRKAA
jgi:protein O-GlcNAc transferase